MKVLHMRFLSDGRGRINSLQRKQIFSRVLIPTCFHVSTVGEASASLTSVVKRCTVRVVERAVLVAFFSTPRFSTCEQVNDLYGPLSFHAHLMNMTTPYSIPEISLYEIVYMEVLISLSDSLPYVCTSTLCAFCSHIKSCLFLQPLLHL